MNLFISIRIGIESLLFAVTATLIGLSAHITSSGTTDPSVTILSLVSAIAMLGWLIPVMGRWIFPEATLDRWHAKELLWITIALVLWLFYLILNHELGGSLQNACPSDVSTLVCREIQAQMVLSIILSIFLSFEFVYLVTHGTARNPREGDVENEVGDDGGPTAGTQDIPLQPMDAVRAYNMPL